MTALIVGTTLALLALGFVLIPLYRAEASTDKARPQPVRRAAAGRERDDAVDALREIEFDQATGKLSDADYTTMKATYTERALSAMRAADAAGVRAAGGSEAAVDLAEAVISRFKAGPRSCAECGPRPESDAAYCSSCGGYLAGRCSACDAPVRETGARFCSDCGHDLAAA